MDTPPVPPDVQPSPPHTARPSPSRSQSQTQPSSPPPSPPPADHPTSTYISHLRSFSQPQLSYLTRPRTSPNSAAPSILEESGARRPSNLDVFAPICASARTSYTRVDATATAPGTPPPEPADGPLQLQIPLEGPALSRGGDTVEGEDDMELDPEKSGHHEQEEVPQLPQIVLTFLLISGRRRTMSFDLETTIGRVKELVWNAWPHEWQDERPPAPSYLRILYLGKILQDDDTLSKWSFPVTYPAQARPASPSSHSHSPASPVAPAQPTVVHLSIRACAPSGGADDAPKKKRRRGLSASGSTDADVGDAEEAGCCGCVIC